MFKFLLRILVNALALWIAGLILPGLSIGPAAGTTIPGNPTTAAVIAYLFIGLLFALVNMLVRPIIRLLSLPVTILTLGLFSIVINAAMLYLTSWLSSFTPIRFRIDEFFWTAILAAIIISVISLLAGAAARPLTRKR
ncbi:MAG: phage holin family protein [Actinomycetales bacterium]|jgi:putative membrane protein